MTYSEEQARAMVRAAVRWAREMPEASEDAIVARVLADAGAGQPVPLPPEATPEVLRGVAAELRRLEARAERWAQNLAKNGGTPTYCRAEAAVYRALAELVEREAARREQAGAAQGKGEAYDGDA